MEQGTMTPKQQRLRVADLDLAVIDPFERTTQYIYDEIFAAGIYDHPRIKLPERPTIIDVGANIGLFTIWAARKYRPRTILAYEASPTTHECLVENVARHVNSEVTGATCFNLAVSREAGRELVLHQPPWVCGLSTILDGSTLPWIDELRDKGELHTHKVRSTTISREIAVQGLAAVDLLKIDVEGYFMEVLEGIAPADMAKVRNIVLEAEYAEALGHPATPLRHAAPQGLRRRGAGRGADHDLRLARLICPWAITAQRPAQSGHVNFPEREPYANDQRVLDSAAHHAAWQPAARSRRRGFGPELGLGGEPRTLMSAVMSSSGRAGFLITGAFGKCWRTSSSE